MGKAQFLGRPVMYILVIVVVIFLVIFGMREVYNANNRMEEARLTSFTLSIKNRLDIKSTRTGDVSEAVFSLPDKTEQICFVDSTKEFDSFVDTGLSIEVKNYPGFDVYLFPSEEFTPLNIEGFRLKYEQNPLCIKPDDEKIKLLLENMGDFAEITSSEVDMDVDCVSLVYNGNPNDKIDIVFLSYGYDEVRNFASDADRYINEQFYTIEPFASNWEKINFYRIDSFSPELHCEIGNLIRCDEYGIKQVASQCPNDFIYILVNRNLVQDFVNPVRSSAVSNMIKLNTADKDILAMHELGHVFAYLADEYVDENYYGSVDFDVEDYPNCDFEECKKWEMFGEAGCFSGCSLNTYFRPTRDSIMRSTSSDTYGPVNINEIDIRMEHYT